MGPGLFWVVSFKVFLSVGLSLRAALGVFLTNTWDGTSNDREGSPTPGRNRETWGDLFEPVFMSSTSCWKYSIRARGFVVLLFLIDVFALDELLFSRPMSMSSDARDVSRVGYGSKLLIG